MSLDVSQKYFDPKVAVTAKT